MMKNAIYTSEKNWNRSIRINKKINNIKQNCMHGGKIYSNVWNILISNWVTCSFELFLFSDRVSVFKYCQIFD